MLPDHFPFLLDHCLAGLYILSGDRIVWINATAAGMIGWKPEELVGRSFLELVHPADLPLVTAKAEGGVAYIVRAARRDGELVHLETHQRAVVVGGQQMISGAILDVSERVRAEAAEREADRRLREVLQQTQFLVLQLDSQGSIEFCNDAVLRVTGHERDEMLGKNWFELCVPADQRDRRHRGYLEAMLPGGLLGALEEREVLTRSGDRRMVEWNIVPLRERDGRVVGCSAMGTDVTDRRRAADKLLHDAFHDSLTGLPNRALFLDRLEHRLALEKRRHQTSFSVLVLDVDRFKVINDSLGHVLGDQLLIEVGRRLQTTLRPGDTVARLSGDEFTILLEDVPNAADARNVADRLHEEDADTALYRAKAQGRGRCVEFDVSMHDRAVELLHLETALRRALDRREFRIHYQPVVSLTTGQITGAEALLRWKHPERGLVPPMDFIPLAEETGLIVEIGAWVLKEACRQMKEWQEKLGQAQLEIGVNLSSRQFQVPGLVAQVAEVLQSTGLSPRSLRLEVTESLLMDKHPNVAQTMIELRAMGVRIDLDDFGTGYSSLSYLHQFPIDTLKIDRSFVQRMGSTDDALEIVNTILALAHSLDMEVVAEGVETEQQLELLRKMRCSYAQGYHLSRPIEALQFETLLGTRRSWAA